LEEQDLFIASNLA